MKYIPLIVALLFSPLVINATDNLYTLGGNHNGTAVADRNLLSIDILPNGKCCIYRYIQASTGNKWYSQLYSLDNHLFSIKIGNTVYSSGGTRYPPGSEPLFGLTLTPFTTIEDVSTSNLGVKGVQEVVKIFSGMHEGNPFSVTMTISYDTSAPEYFVLKASIDAREIPEDTPIAFSHGWDIYVNTSDKGFAYIIPNTLNANDNSTVITRTLTLDQTHDLRLVGGHNTIGSKALIGFFPMGRKFDGVYSDSCRQAASYNLLFADKYTLKFGPYDNGNLPRLLDNGVGVVYKDIPAGEVTEINTGVTFTSALDGELDYTWGTNNSKDYVANVGDEVNLNLSYTSYSGVDLTDIGFQVNFPGLSIREGGCTSSGFTSASVVCIPGNDYYKVSNAHLNSFGKAQITIPVKIMQAGKWMVDGNSISNMSRTLPLGSRATLTVKTGVVFASDTMQYMCPGTSRTLTIWSSSNATVAEDVEVYLSYSGDTDAFSSLPATVTIPAGEKSASFMIESLLAVPERKDLTITLSGTNQDFLGIGTITTTQIVMEPWTTPSVELSASPDFNVCEEKVESITFTAIPVHGGTKPVYTWKINGKEVQSGEENTFTLTNLRLYHESTVSCTMEVGTIEQEATCEKAVRVSSCTIPVNPHIRGKVY